MADPWMMLAVMASSEDCWSRNTVQWEWLLKKSASQLYMQSRVTTTLFTRTK